VFSDVLKVRLVRWFVFASVTALSLLITTNEARLRQLNDSITHPISPCSTWRTKNNNILSAVLQYISLNRFACNQCCIGLYSTIYTKTLYCPVVKAIKSNKIKCVMEMTP